MDETRIQMILKLVEDAFDCNVETNAWLDFGQPMADLLGKQNMLDEIEDKLKEF